MRETCKYEGCEHRPSPNAEKLCRFHAPTHVKGISAEEYKRNLFQLINDGETNFAGFKIPDGFSFADKNFPNGANFADAEFFGDGLSSANFSSVIFQGLVSFSGAKFFNSANFSHTKFTGNSTSSVDFSDVNFHKNVRFDITKFSKGEVSFYNTQFHERTQFQSSEFKSGVNFTEATFHKGETLFTNVSFGGDRTLFNKTKFPNGNLTLMGSIFESEHTGFNSCEFGDSLIFKHKCRFLSKKTTIENLTDVKKLEFTDCEFISVAASINNLENVNELKITDCHFSGSIELSVLTFSENAIFKLENITWPKQPKSVVVLFKDIIFPPFRTYFNDNRLECNLDLPEVFDSPIILFRYCRLKDVYFVNSDMFLFSFFASTGYEEAHFFSRNWGHHQARLFKHFRWFKHHRTNRIFEERILDKIGFTKKGKVALSDKTNVFHIDNLAGYRNVALIYRNLKTAFDRAKDYRGAGRQYFGEFEMKRLAYFIDIKAHGHSIWDKFKYGMKGWSYGAYKLIAGYGEKPQWTVLWFVFFWLLFTTIHFLNGIENNTHQIINYDLVSFSVFFENIGKCATDFIKVLAYTISQILPAAYFPGLKTGWHPQSSDLWRVGLSFLNTSVLGTLLIFIAIGLKRHFRRF